MEALSQDGNIYVYLSASLGILTLIFVFYNRNRKNLPPGPYPLPVIGNLYLVSKGDTLHTFRELRSKYGDLYSLKLGLFDAVMVNGYDTLKELLVKRGDDVSDRPDTFIFKDIGGGRGIGGSSGSLWKIHRAFALTTLRSFGLGKRNIEERIMEELSFFLQEVESKNDEAFNLNGIIQPSISNIICSIIFGKRFEYTDARFVKLVELLDINFSLVGPSALISFFPFLKYIPGDPCKGKVILSNANKVIEFLKELIKEHNESFNEDNIRDYIDAYLKEMKLNRSTFTDSQLAWSIADMFAAGTETTATAFKWAILYLLHYPEVQTKMRQELDIVVGTSRPPSLDDRRHLPYSEAVVTEVLRCGNIAPLSLQHSCHKDVVFRGYTIPKGTLIIPNLDSVLSDSIVFEDAEKFNPARFIDDNGELYGVEKVIPFSIGRRVCLGESLARSELFLYLTSMVQRFECVPKDEKNLPKLDGILGLARAPHPYEFRALKRNY